MSIVKEAQRLISSRLSVIPIKAGSKSPAIDGWKQFQTVPMTLEDVRNSFHPGDRIAVLGGRASDNLELIDFDVPGIYDEWRATLVNTGHGDAVASLVVETTPKGGCHAYYRCDAIEGNRKLAQRPPTAEEAISAPKTKQYARIETRGDGGYAVCYPSDGYRLIQGDLGKIPKITPEIRSVFIGVARMFDQMPQSAQQPTERHARQTDGTTPGDDFNARGSWADEVLDGVWEWKYSHGPRDYWHRIGSSNKVGASTGNGPDDLMYVWSTSTELQPERGYSKFGVLALTKFGGDFSACARYLASKDYGKQRDKSALNGHIELPSEHNDEVPPADPPELSITRDPDQFNQTDQGNAERLVKAFGKDFRHCHSFSSWFNWDGVRWQEDHTGGAQIRRMAIYVVRAMGAESKLIPDDDEKAKACKFALASEHISRQNAMVEMSKKELPIPITPDDLDTDLLSLNVLNGTIDLRTGKLRDHDRSNLITRLSPIEFDPSAKCPRFMQFLMEVLPTSPEMQNYIQRVWGYCLTGDTRADAFFFCHGEGANGKSLFIELLKKILADYGLVIPIEALMVQKAQRMPVEIAEMRKKRVVVASEAPENRTLDASQIKWLTGRDEISAQRKYGHPFTFNPSHKLWMSGNHQPNITDQSDGMWRRVHMIPFLNQFPVGSPLRDDQLMDKLLAESPGILAWMVRGCLLFLEDGLQTPPEVLAAVSEYRDDMDTLGEFLAECCDVTDAFAEVSSSDLYAEYRRWCKVVGQKEWTQKMLGQKLKSKKFKNSRTNNKRSWSGIQLLPGAGDQQSANYWED